MEVTLVPAFHWISGPGPCLDMDPSKEIPTFCRLFTLTHTSLSLMGLKLYLDLLHIAHKMGGNRLLLLVFLQCPFSLLLLLLDNFPSLFLIKNSHAQLTLNLMSLYHILHYPSLSCPWTNLRSLPSFPEDFGAWFTVSFSSTTLGIIIYGFNIQGDGTSSILASQFLKHSLYVPSNTTHSPGFYSTYLLFFLSVLCWFLLIS